MEGKDLQQQQQRLQFLPSNEQVHTEWYNQSAYEMRYQNGHRTNDTRCKNNDTTKVYVGGYDQDAYGIMQDHVACGMIQGAHGMLQLKFTWNTIPMCAQN
uniref:Uncharacterized protein n=1 Tax=Arion vulgaris TaxID=1028688 RepID=A0A0B7AJG5_9EUPU